MCFRVYPARSCPWCVPRWVCRNGGFVKSDEQPQLRLIISHSIEMGYFAYEPLRYIDFLWFSESWKVWLNFQSPISSDLFECFCMKLRSHGCMSLSFCETVVKLSIEFGGILGIPVLRMKPWTLVTPYLPMPRRSRHVSRFVFGFASAAAAKIFFFWPGKQKAWCRGNKRSCFSALLLFFVCFIFAAHSCWKT